MYQSQNVCIIEVILKMQLEIRSNVWVLGFENRNIYHFHFHYLIILSKIIFCCYYFLSRVCIDVTMKHNGVLCCDINLIHFKSLELDTFCEFQSHSWHWTLSKWLTLYEARMTCVLSVAIVCFWKIDKSGIVLFWSKSLSTTTF